MKHYRHKRQKSKNTVKFSTGEDFEDRILGKHETLHFEIKLSSSFAACFANAIMAQPKGHDPDQPTDDFLVLIRNKVGQSLGSAVSLYNCRKLPIDILHSTDLLIVSWQHKSFVTIDLTLDAEGQSKADLKFLYKHYKRSSSLQLLCEEISRKLKENEGRITLEMLKLIPKGLVPKGNSS